MTNSYDPKAPRPDVGTVWAWEPALPHAAELVMVTDVKWNGEEWHVASVPVRLARGALPSLLHVHQSWNDLSRWWEAVHSIRAVAGPGRADVRRGPPQPAELTKPD